MDNNKIMIVGTGNVGASIAFALLNQRTPVNEIILTDILAHDAEGEMMDLSDALTVSPSYLKIKNGTYRDAKDCDVVIIAAGAARKSNQSAKDYLLKNANIVKGMVEQIMASGFNGIFIVVTEPVDTITKLVQKVSGLPSEKVIGTGTMLSSSRLRQRIAEYLDLNPKSVNACVLGEQGESGVVAWSLAGSGGQKITTLLPADTLADVEDFVKHKTADITKKKGATFYGIAACVVELLNCIFNDERRIFTISVYDDFTDLYYGYPAVIGRTGVMRRLDLQLTEKEGIAMQRSINSLKQSIAPLALAKNIH